ncbi:MAG: CoA transferase [Anaerolineae bacterium]|nr:CoA transferase [Anaerolineae bacterium]
MAGPLEGVIVADFTQLAQGPVATQILGDLGAEIIKIEPPKGDWMRHFSLRELYIGGESVSFLSFNRNKRSIAVDLKKPEGVDVVKRLVEKADVVVENFRPGVMDRLGLGYETLNQLNPRLVYCASCGFGQSGPYVTRPGQDLLIQSMSGMTVLTGNRDDIPSATIVGIADLTASQLIVYGVCAALFNRERTGKGQRVDVNLYNALLGLTLQEIGNYLNGGGMPERSERGYPNPYVGAPYGIYHTQDRYIAIAMNPINKLARLLGVEGLDHITGQNVMEDADEIRDRLAAAFVEKTTAEWLDILLAEDIWCAPVYEFADVEKDPQVLLNEMVISYRHPTAGTVRAVGIPVKFQGTPGEIRYPAPLLGQHSVEILREFTPYGDSEISELLEKKVVLNSHG